MKATGEPPFLSTIPLGTALAALLRLAVSTDRREEFLGDLIEEARLREPRCSRGELALWLWAQVLRSLPALLGSRARRLAAAPWVGPTPVRAGGGLLVATRGNQRGWPLSLAVSVSAHGLVLVSALAWLFARVEEVQPVRTPMEVLAGVVFDAREPEPQPAIPTGAVTARTEDTAPVRRPRLRRVLATVSPAPAAAPIPGTTLPGSAVPATMSLTAQPPPNATGPATDMATPMALPPRIAEKRCLRCPPPQLPPAYAHLARGQDMLVRTCVSRAGEIVSVDVLRGFDATVNREVTATIRQWRLVPYQLDGHNVPFCYATRFIFATT